MQAIFFDSVTEVIRDENFPRVNHIIEKDLEKLNSMSVEELKELAKQVRYWTFEFQILFTSIVGVHTSREYFGPVIYTARRK